MKFKQFDISNQSVCDVTFGRYSTLNVEMLEMLSATHSKMNLSSSELTLSDLNAGGAALPIKIKNNDVQFLSTGNLFI